MWFGLGLVSTPPAVPTSDHCSPSAHLFSPLIVVARHGLLLLFRPVGGGATLAQVIFLVVVYAVIALARLARVLDVHLGGNSASAEFFLFVVKTRQVSVGVGVE